MKRMIAAVLAVFMLASVLTMAVSAKGSDDLLETIQERGTIIVWKGTGHLGPMWMKTMS